MHYQRQYGIALGLIQAFKMGHLEYGEFLAKLQKLFPFNPRSFRLDTWEIMETVLNYYGLSSENIFSCFDKFALNDLFRSIDEEQIFDLLTNCRQHKVCDHKARILLKELFFFFKEKQVPIPEHLTLLEQHTVKDESNEAHSVDEAVEITSKEIKLPKQRKESYRREIMRAAATLF